jgi:hypothetical protein
VLPKYPNCPLTVFYQVRFCGPVAQITNVSISFDAFGNAACGKLFEDLFSASFIGPPAASALFFTNFWSSIETEISDAYFESVITGTPPDAWNCSNPNRRILTASFYRGACLTFCVGKDPKGQLKVSTGACSSTCCVKNISYCTDDLGNPVITESTSLMPGGSACSFTPPSDSCPEGTLFQSPCIEFCK